MFTSLLGFGLLTYCVNLIPLELLLLPLYKAFNIKVYTFWKKEDCLTLQKKLENWTRQNHDGKGYGYAISTSYYAYLSIGGDTPTFSAWIICTDRTYKFLFDEPRQEPVHEIKKKENVPLPFKVLKKASGSYANTYYRKDTGLLRFTPTVKQLVILEKIEERFAQTGYAVVLLTGPPNIGKSMIGVFLAQRLSASYCNEFTPWVPGDSLALLNYDHDTDTAPLVISLDEVDDALVKIATGKIASNPKLIISTPDKKGWNTMFDNIERSIQKNIIIIMTSNLSREEINNKCGDESFLRNPRVTDYFEMT